MVSSLLVGSSSYLYGTGVKGSRGVGLAITLLVCAANLIVVLHPDR